MRSDATFAYQEQERDSALLERHLKGQADLTSPAARHHLSGGFNRRLLMLATGRRAIETITHSPQDAPIGAPSRDELRLAGPVARLPGYGAGGGYMRTTMESKGAPALASPNFSRPFKYSTVCLMA